MARARGAVAEPPAAGWSRPARHRRPPHPHHPLGRRPGARASSVATPPRPACGRARDRRPRHLAGYRELTRCRGSSVPDGLELIPASRSTRSSTAIDPMSGRASSTSSASAWIRTTRRSRRHLAGQRERGGRGFAGRRAPARARHRRSTIRSPISTGRGRCPRAADDRPGAHRRRLRHEREDAFDRIDARRPAYVPREGMGRARRSLAIRAAGGIAGPRPLPGGAGPSRADRELMDAGLRGLEVHYRASTRSTTVRGGRFARNSGSSPPAEPTTMATVGVRRRACRLWVPPDEVGDGLRTPSQAEPGPSHDRSGPRGPHAARPRSRPADAPRPSGASRLCPWTSVWRSSGRNRGPALPSFHVWTLGCQMNRSDSEEMAGACSPPAAPRRAPSMDERRPRRHQHVRDPRGGRAEGDRPPGAPHPAQDGEPGHCASC
jgi:hypothetical protein